MVAVQSVFEEKIVTDLIYTRFVFVAQKNQNDIRYPPHAERQLLNSTKYYKMITDS